MALKKAVSRLLGHRDRQRQRELRAAARQAPDNPPPAHLQHSAIFEKLRDDGPAFEIEFWRQFVQSDRFKHNWCRLVPNPELESEIDLFVKTIANERLGKGVRILDIGSGPVSILTNSFPHMDVELVAADPLAADYDGLWNDPIKGSVCTPVKCAGEDLVQTFGPASFDVAHIRNALDHSVSPVATFQQMTDVVKRGGYIIVHGFENEALAENWAGFHQWNITREGDDLWVSGQDGISRPLIGSTDGRAKAVSVYTSPIGHRVWCGLVAAVN